MVKPDEMSVALDVYLKSGFSRRELLRASLAAGGLVALAPFVASAAGNGGGREFTGAVNQDDVQWAEAPVRFVWVDYAEPATIDPALLQSSNDFTFGRNVYEPLVELDPVKLELFPALATEYSIAEDGKTYTFLLREGVTFHSGAPFTADDVKATIERVQAIN